MLLDARTLADRDRRIEADVCVVGSGAGGAVAACELAEAGRRVVVLEEGGAFSAAAGDFAHTPLDRMRRLYREGGALVALGAPGIPLPVGAAVGGTTLI